MKELEEYGEIYDKDLNTKKLLYVKPKYLIKRIFNIYIRFNLIIYVRF